MRGDGGATLFPIVVSRSTDGRAFSEPVQILPNNANNNLKTATVLADGTLLVIFYDIGAGGRKLFERFRIWAVRSQDRGQSFGVPLFVAEYLKGDLVEVAVDTARGEVHAVWDDFEGGAAGIYLARSADGGRRWSEALRISDPVPGTRQQLNPSVAIDPQGMLAVHWMDFRNDPKGECYQPYFTVSTDGGRTFLPGQRLSSVPSCPKSPGNVVKMADGSTSDVAARWPEGGDYHGLLAGAPGRFYALWADSRTGVLQLRFTTIVVAAADADR